LVPAQGKTCSFTFQLETKTILKSLAKGHKTTETALIQCLIEVTAQAAAEEKEVMRRDSQIAKVTRHARTLTQELDQARIYRTRTQLQHCVNLLAQWNTFP